MQKKVRLFALRSALSAKFSQNELIIVDSLALESHKTKDFLKVKKIDWKLDDSVLLVGDETEIWNAKLATQNIFEGKACTVLRSRSLNVYDLLKHKHVIISVEGLRFIHAFLSKSNKAIASKI